MVLADQTTSFTLMTPHHFGPTTHSHRFRLLIRRVCLKMGYPPNLLVLPSIKVAILRYPILQSLLGAFIYVDLRTSQVIKQIKLERRSGPSTGGLVINLKGFDALRNMLRTMVQLSFSVKLG